MLGGTVDERFLTAFKPVVCAIGNAIAEDQNFVAAAGSGITAEPADDYAIAESRQAIFEARRKELLTAKATIAERLGAPNERTRPLIEAAKLDLDDVLALVQYDRTLPPDDAVEPPDVVPGRLAAAIETETAEVQSALGGCPVPPDLARRTRIYNG